MAEDYLKDRTFQLYYFDQKAFPDFAVQSQCASSHRRPDVAFDFHALQIDQDELRPIVLKFKDQNFRAVATEWELKNSAILNAGGLTPMVDDEGVVVGYLGNKDPVATYMRPLVNVDGIKVLEHWDEPPLESSLPFEVGMMMMGGFGTRGIVKGALRKSWKAGPAIIRLKGAIRGALLKTSLRKFLVPKPLPSINRSFDYFSDPSDMYSGFTPNFHATVRNEGNHIVYRIVNQVTKGGTLDQQLAAAKKRTEAIRAAAELAKQHKRPTFIMRIEQANQGSRDGAEKLLRKLGQPPMAPLETTPIPGAKPFLEYVLETEKVLMNVH